MKIGDHIYLITDRLQTGAGIPGRISGLQDSTVELVLESIDGPKVLKVGNWEDIMPSNLYAHSILNLVYETCDLPSEIPSLPREMWNPAERYGRV